MCSSVITSIVSFASTNIDDIFVLMILFAQLDLKKDRKNIVIGQYLGIGILVMVSLLGAFGLQFVPQKYVGLLGIVPIILGIKSYIEYKREKKNEISEKTSNGDLSDKKTKSNATGILSVMMFTVANGADNIGVYMPLFAAYSVAQLIVAIIIFAVMTALWCFLGNLLATVPSLKSIIQKYKHIAIPVVFILLGIYIIAESGLVSALFI